MKLLYIQPSGDFSEAYKRLFVDFGQENYYGQKYSVGAVVDQARRGIEVMVIVLNSTGYYDKLEENLYSIGFCPADNKYVKIEEKVDSFDPDRVILRLPDVNILRMLRRKKISTFPVFADSFENMGRFRGRIQKYFLSRELKNKDIKWIANHQINASLSVQKLGVGAEKIIPYDWEHPSTPRDWSKKAAKNIDNKEIEIFYAGAINKSKGVYDLVDALKIIKQSNRQVQLRIAGKFADQFRHYIDKVGLGGQVTLLGSISHNEVLQNMNCADLVAVPSRHDYPEGLPMTIMESLMVGTPVIASDHPMFVDRVGKRGAVCFFAEKSPQSIANTLLDVCSDPQSYFNKCENAPLEWYDLCLDLKWADMVNQWIGDPKGCDFSHYTIEKIA